MSRSGRLAMCLAVLAVVLLAAGPALAHKVNVYAFVEDGSIAGEGYFADGGKARKVPVSIEDASGRELSRTVTGEDGTFRLPLPAGTAPLTVVLTASEGHRNTYVLTAADLGQTGAAASASPPAVPVQAAPAPATSETPQAWTAPASAAQTIPASDADRIAQAVDKAVEARLAPIRAQLARLAEQGDKVSLKDVVGGLGWILGLFGAAAYAASRRPGQGKGGS